VSVQLGVSVTDALIRLRAYAFVKDRLLRETPRCSRSKAAVLTTGYFCGGGGDDA